MGKNIFIIIALAFLYCNCGQSLTKKAFLNDVNAPALVYKNDSLVFLSLLNKDMAEQVPPFNSKTYFDSTIIFIDTIIYNKLINKSTVFVIVRSSTSQLADPNPAYALYYDAFCFLGEKNIKNIWSLRWFNVFNLVTFYDINDIKS